MTTPGVAGAGTVRVEDLDGGSVRRVTLCTGKGNVLTGTALAALAEAFRAAGAAPDLRAVLLEAEGPHFSFGASVEEHLPGRVEEMFSHLRGLLVAMLDAAVPTVTVVRGACLGGGLEVALLAHRIVASPDARLGFPEITLGVFAPAGSIALAERVGRARAEDLLLTGRVVGAEEALRIGLVDELAADPSEVALSWVRTHLLPKSASSLRFAARAARLAFAARFREELEGQERLYLEGLSGTADAVEGLQAFLAKRPPVWRNE